MVSIGALEKVDCSLGHFRSTNQGLLHEQWLAVGKARTVANYCLEFLGRATYLAKKSRIVVFCSFH